MERLDGELSEPDDRGGPLTFGKVAVAVVGNEDNAAHLTRHLVTEPYPGVKA